MTELGGGRGDVWHLHLRAHDRGPLTAASNEALHLSAPLRGAAGERQAVGSH